MEEDSDDKIRRNLIVASTAVLLGAWLELPAASVMKRLLGDDISATVQPWRLWTAALALLVYLILRYKFSPGALRAWFLCKEEFARFRRERVKVILDQEFKQFSRTASEPLKIRLMQLRRGYSEPPSMRGQVLPYLKSRGIADFDLRQGGLLFELQHIKHETPNAGLLQIVVTKRNDPTVLDAGGTNLPFEVKGLRMLRVTTVACARLLTYSVASTSFLVPIAIATGATAVAILRLVQALS